MRVLSDFRGLAIRVTDERLAHILEHPEMVGMEAAIEETLLDPVQVVQSFSDPEAHLTIATTWAPELATSTCRWS